MERKIIFAGPVGAGKTTAIDTISDIPVVSTEQAASDEVALRKANTTVAMDYGVLNLDDGLRVHLYGAPGQDRFDFMWEILTLGGMGLVLLLDRSSERFMADLNHFLNAFERFIRQVDGAVVIGITRNDIAAETGLTPVRQVLQQRGLNVPLFEVDARDKRDVRQLLLALLANVHPAVARSL